MTYRSTLRTALAIALAFFPSACIGEVGPEAPPPGTPPDTPPTDPTLLECNTDSPDPGPSLIRRLTHREYNNTLRDVLDDARSLADGFGGDTEGLGFTTNSAAQFTSDTLVHHYADAALSVAQDAQARWPTLVGCDPAALGDDECAREWIREFGLRAYRRPVANPEVDRLAELHAAGREAEAGDFGGGVRWVVQAMLQSPHFLYRVERGREGTEASDRIELSSFELASRMSYLVWASAPDENLLAKAEADELRTEEQIASEISLMLTDERARRTELAFHTEWAGLAHVAGAQREGLTPEIAAALVEESQRFAAWAFWDAGTMNDLLASPVSFRNGALSEFYGEAGPSGEAFEMVSLDPAQRAGLFTQGSIMTLYAKLNRSAPVHRGRFVLDRVLCENLPDPPDDVDTSVPTPDPGETLRTQLTQHSNVPACSGCHSLIDSIGFAFEHYDQVGRFREEDNGSPIDATGDYPGDAITVPYDGAVELAAQFTNNDVVALCVATHWYRYAMGRAERREDGCARRHIFEHFVSEGYQLKEILVAIATSEAFRYRRTSELSP